MNRLSRIFACAILLITSFTVFAQDAPPDPACPGAPAPRLIMNAQGVVSPGQSNNLRDQPSRNGAKVGEIPAEGQFTILEGPVCADGLNWWRVDFGGLVGWTVEGQGADYWTAPVSSGDTASGQTAPETVPNPYRNPQFRVTNSLQVDAQARLQSPNGESLAIYAAPDANSETVAELPAGTIVTLAEEGTGGWWRVLTDDGVEGWLQEGVAAPDRLSDYYLTIAPLCPYTEDRIAFAAYDTQIGVNLYTIGADARRLCNLTYGAQSDYDAFTWSPDGSALAFSATSLPIGQRPTETDLYVIAADGRDFRRLTTGKVVQSIAWTASREDTPIAFTMQSEDNPDRGYIYLTDSQGTTMHQLTPEAVRRGALRWSPDGTRLAFIEEIETEGDYHASIMLIDIASGEKTELFVSDWRAESLSWHPDGTSLLASVYINTGRNVLVEINIETGEYEVLYDFENRGAVYSADGSRIALWHTILQAPRQLMLLDSTTHEVTKLATLPGVNRRWIAWTADDTALLVDSGGVLRVDVASGLYESVFLGSLSSATTPPLPQPVR